MFCHRFKSLNTLHKIDCAYQAFFGNPARNKPRRHFLLTFADLFCQKIYVVLDMMHCISGIEDNVLLNPNTMFDGKINFFTHYIDGNMTYLVFLKKRDFIIIVLFKI